MFKIKNYEDARSTLRKTLTCSILFCVGSLFLPASLEIFRAACVCIAVLFFAVTIYVVIKFCRCPKCGKIMFFGALAVTSCPRCHANLNTGKKEKKKR